MAAEGHRRSAPTPYRCQQGRASPAGTHPQRTRRFESSDTTVVLVHRSPISLHATAVALPHSATSTQPRPSAISSTRSRDPSAGSAGSSSSGSSARTTGAPTSAAASRTLDALKAGRGPAPGPGRYMTMASWSSSRADVEEVLLWGKPSGGRSRAPRLARRAATSEVGDEARDERHEEDLAADRLEGRDRPADVRGRGDVAVSQGREGGE